MKNSNIVHIFDWEDIAALARRTVAEGCVLIKNENKALPINEKERVAVFGRSLFNYYKSGTGSGGAVNAPYVISILDALMEADENEEIILDKDVIASYEEWLKDNPFDAGIGWAAEPWNQKEMPLKDSIVLEASKKNDLAIFVVGRTAGEDQDNRVAAGSYMLTDTEEKAIATIRKHFNRVVIVLNTGNIVDVKWMDIYNPDAVLFAWQGGQVGGAGVVDVLLGRVNPSGRLADTIAGFMADYSSTANFGDDNRDIYAEDIYVGYRYFETFAKDKVIYPFGYGLSYTDFEITSSRVNTESDSLQFVFDVENIGDREGQEVVQLFVSKPQGVLGKPARELVGFAKTSDIMPGAHEEVTINVALSALSSYDDSGVTGFDASFVVEKGQYDFFAGKNVRDSKMIFSLNFGDTTVVQKCGHALMPTVKFDRMKPELINGEYAVSYEAAPNRNYNLQARITEKRPADIPYSGDKGIKLNDVYSGNNTLEEFIAQLSDLDLIHMSRGEGMCSPKVTAGTASAFGGVTESLKGFGIPVGCCADGPSGIRMDCGTAAFSMPNGTLLACTFNTELVEKLYELEGMDLRRNKVDLLLGPGINMHRHPLNGRNFEYFSEDPYLTGIMAVAQLKGMAKHGVSGTIKHFAGNEQEWRRYDIDSVISERALREIYLKPFELAVKEGKAYSVMTTYGSLNGQWTAGNYDLVTTILRDEWGFEGIVMTDWWAQINEENEAPSKTNTIPMVRAQNDVYMVVTDALTNSGKDNTEEGLANGKLTRGELARNAMNICRALMKSPCMKRLATGEEETWNEIGLPEGSIEKVDWTTEFDVSKTNEIATEDMPTDKGIVDEILVTFEKKGFYKIYFDLSSNEASEIAQMPMNVFSGPNLIGTITINGTGGEIITKSLDLVAEVVLTVNVRLKFSMSGIRVHKIRIEFDKESALA